MGAPKRPEGDQLLARMEAWGDTWRAAAGSTERADRPRAEAALRSLYVAAGRPEPVVAWVPSPAAGILTYAFASRDRGRVISEYARGEVGTGRNREFNGTATPFGMEPAWIGRIAAKVAGWIPPERLPGPDPTTNRPVAWVRDPVDTAAMAFGLSGTTRVMPLVRAAIDAGRSAVADGDDGANDPMDGSLADAAAAAVLGTAWPRLVAALGLELARELFVGSTRSVAQSALRDGQRRRNALQAMQPGQWDAETPVLAAARDVFDGYLWRRLDGRAAREAQVDARLELARSAGPWWALDGLAIVSERPLVLHRDDRGRPHRADGPAIAWPDGLEAWAWHGVAVEPWVITDPERITVRTIDGERNTEVRRVLVERFGEERLVREGGATLVHEDETGRLWRRDYDARPAWAGGWWRPRDEPVAVVEVVNSTPEPDGSRKTYFLRVPPTITTAREAVAWTFALGAGEYRPAVET